MGTSAVKDSRTKPKVKANNGGTCKCKTSATGPNWREMARTQQYALYNVSNRYETLDLRK